MEYSELSISLTNKLSKEEKKKDGIYFTPPSCVHKTLKILAPYLKKAKHVIEPSCGSCEYVNALHSLYPHLQIRAIEYNKTIYDSIKHLQNKNVRIYNMDYLSYDADADADALADIIIGNPPYYVIKKENVDKKYHTYFEGRPNLFILFIIHSESLLREKGILSFILPKSFINCLYYDKTRKFITERFTILHIIDCVDDKYIETQQETISLTIQKKDVKSKNKSDKSKSDKSKSDKYVLQYKEYTIFATEDMKEKLSKLYENSKSLHELGFKVSVGNVVWNQCKNILTDDTNKTRLIYSSDIRDNSLKLKKYTNAEKKNFINKKGITRPMIVINRGYGVGEYKFNYCIIDEANEYLIENHLICIEAVDENLNRDALIEKYKKILVSLNDKRTSEFISIYFGNNAINTTELNHILPIYTDVDSA